ncbi:MAG TPA: NHL repeat-containing protein [Gemmatimonadaceae bacterium]|nr:NHL repeat-containing protein [Gemmatimonadaceae bacterium]
MTRPTVISTLLAISLVAASSCGYDSTSPTYNPPPPPPPPPDSTAPNGLWTAAASNPTILRLASSQLVSNGAITPATEIFTSSAELFNLNGVAFDSDGTMWVTSESDSVLVGFSPTTLGKHGFAVANTRIASVAGSLSGPTSVAFDAQHRLWVANSANGTIVRFDRDQLSTSGAPVPAVIISGLRHPGSLAFDATGSIWISDTQAQNVVSFSPGQLSASGSPAPRIVLSAVGNSGASPAGIAFDAQGNLWVADAALQRLVSYNPQQLSTSGSPAPHVTISSHEGSLLVATGLAFDADGSLWVIEGSGTLEKFTRESLAVSGAPSPSVHLKLKRYVLFWSLAFWPKPAGLPLN